MFTVPISNYSYIILYTIYYNLLYFIIILYYKVSCFDYSVLPPPSPSLSIPLPLPLPRFLTK